MTEANQIRRRADGSIDTAYYMSEGHTRRSQAAHDALTKGAVKTRRPLFGLAALLALIPFVTGQS